MNFEDLALSRTFKVSNGAIKESTGRPVTAVETIEGEDFELEVRPTRPLITLEPGTVVDSKYRVVELLGTGGMGAVYRVLHLQLNREVALKTLLTEELTEDSWLRFKREAQSIAKLDDINIVKVFDFGIGEGNHPYYTMEVLTGESLADRLKGNGPMALTEALNCFRAVARALLHAHRLQIVHRDIKPGNIFISEACGGGKENIKLVDFGIAKLATGNDLESQKQTDSGLIFGSPLYMSPEQSHGKTVDERSDIYSFGCSLFETLTGSPPFVGSNVFTTTVMHHTKLPPTLAEANHQGIFSHRLEAMIAKMLAKNPDSRYQNFESVLSEIEIILQDLNSNIVPNAIPGTSLSDGRSPGAKDSEQQGDSAGGGTKKALLLAAAIVVLLAGTALGGKFFLDKKVPAKTVSPPDSSFQLNYDKNIDSSESVNKDSKPLVRPQTYYSRILPDGSRQFNFDYNDELGQLTLIKNFLPQKGSTRNASHTFTVPKGYQVTLKARDLLAEHPELFERFRPDDLYGLQLDQGPDWSKLQFQRLVRFTELRELVVVGCKLDEKFFRSINQLPHLGLLDIPECTTRAEDILQYDGLTRLHSFNCNMTKEVNPVLKKLRNNHNLADLSAEDCDLTDQDLQDIAEIKRIYVLRIGQNKKVTRIGIGALSKMPELHTLMIEGIDLPPECAENFKNFKTLGYIRMNLRNWTPAQIAALKKALPPRCNVDESGHVQEAPKWVN